MKGIKKMKYTLNKNNFIDGMQSEPYNPFSYEALEILWNYFESLDKETEFDPVDGKGLTDVDKKSLAITYLKKATIVLGVIDIGTVAYQTF
jgi:hypothetical protein